MTPIRSQALDDLDRSFPAEWWPLPGRVRIVGKGLAWTFPTLARQRYTGPGRTLLRDFIALASKPAPLIRDFAAQWGVLYICKHALPSTHNPTPRLPSFDPLKDVPERARRMALFDRRCYLAEIKPWVYWEPLDIWRRYARTAGAVLNLACQLRTRQLGDVDDWRLVLGDASWEPPDEWRRPPEKARALSERRFLLANHVNNEWLRRGQVSPTLEWRKGTPGLIFGSKCLFGALAIKLALAVARTEGFALCASCGTYYIPSRRPAPNRRQYCHECGPVVAKRDAARDYRARKAQARQVWKLRGPTT